MSEYQCGFRCQIKKKAAEYVLMQKNNNNGKTYKLQWRSLLLLAFVHFCFVLAEVYLFIVPNFRVQGCIYCCQLKFNNMALRNTFILYFWIIYQTQKRTTFIVFVFQNSVNLEPVTKKNKNLKFQNLTFFNGCSKNYRAAHPQSPFIWLGQIKGRL